MKLQLHPTKPYVIAELGTSCDGSVGNMIELARHAVAAGASAIKVQEHEYQLGPFRDHPAWFQGARNLEGRDGYITRQRGYIDELRMHGPQCPIIASVFSVDYVRMAVSGARPMPDAWKIASGQVTNHELIRACVATGKPIIVSSGMTTREETAAALKLIPKEQLWCFMACTSEYPTPPEHVSPIDAMALHEAWGHGWNFSGFDEQMRTGTVGFSDHTDPDSAAAAIVALTRGARVFERHVCFSQKMYGSDVKHAATVEQFEHYVRELDRASRIPTRDIRDENAKRLESVREQFLVRSA